MILAIVEDLMFGSRIYATARATNRPVVMASNLASALENDYRLIIVDLNHRNDPLGVVRGAKERFPNATIIGYLSHVQTELKAAAREAGCHQVMARSEFSANLEQILTRQNR